MPALFPFRFHIMFGSVRVPVRSDVPLGGPLGGPLGSLFGSMLVSLLVFQFHFTFFPLGITLCWVRLGFRSEDMFH